MLRGGGEEVVFMVVHGFCEAWCSSGSVTGSFGGFLGGGGGLRGGGSVMDLRWWVVVGGSC